MTTGLAPSGEERMAEITRMDQQEGRLELLDLFHVLASCPAVDRAPPIAHLAGARVRAAFRL